MNIESLQSLNLFLERPAGQAVFLLLMVWSLIWKGIALWKSSRNDRQFWFIAILVINSFGILEITYLFFFNKPKNLQLPKDKNDQ